MSADGSYDATSGLLRRRTPTGATSRSWPPSGAAAQAAGGVPRSGAGARAARPDAEAAKGRGAARPRPALRSARAGQDNAGDDHRRRDGCAAADHQRAGHPARRRPGRDPVPARRGRGALPRRDPPDVPSGRGDALRRDGGLPGRRRRRQGAGRDRDPAGARRRSPWSGRPPEPGCCPAPLRDRFGFTGHLDYYSVAELETVLHRSAGLLGIALDEEGGDEIAGRSRGTPRITNRLLRRVRDWAEVHGDGAIDLAAARAALELYEVDELGLDRLDRAVLETLCRRFGGGPVGLSTARRRRGRGDRDGRDRRRALSRARGLLVRTPRGRAATHAAWEHLGWPRRPSAARPPCRSASLARDGPAATGRRARAATRWVAWVDHSCHLWSSGVTHLDSCGGPGHEARATLQMGARAAPSTKASH